MVGELKESGQRLLTTYMDTPRHMCRNILLPLRGYGELSRLCKGQIPLGSTRLVSTRHDSTRVEPMHFGCVELVEEHSSTRSTRRARLA